MDNRVCLNSVTSSATAGKKAAFTEVTSAEACSENVNFSTAVRSRAAFRAAARIGFLLRVAPGAGLSVALREHHLGSPVARSWG
jgi:hypothetical protein